MLISPICTLGGGTYPGRADRDGRDVGPVRRVRATFWRLHCIRRALPDHRFRQGAAEAYPRIRQHGRPRSHEDPRVTLSLHTTTPGRHQHDLGARIIDQRLCRRRRPAERSAASRPSCRRTTWSTLNGGSPPTGPHRRERASVLAAGLKSVCAAGVCPTQFGEVGVPAETLPAVADRAVALASRRAAAVERRDVAGRSRGRPMRPVAGRRPLTLPSRFCRSSPKRLRLPVTQVRARLRRRALGRLCATVAWMPAGPLGVEPGDDPGVSTPAGRSSRDSACAA